jgi:ribosomal protein S18 acetylase RimI-like enzyme
MTVIQTYEHHHFEGVKALWEQVFPNDPPYNRAEAAIPAKLAVQPELFLVAVDGPTVTGTAMAGYDGHRGWLYSVAVAPSHQRMGIGAELVRAAEARLRRMGCGKINLQVRATNDAVVALYRPLGYAVEDRISMGRRIEPEPQRPNVQGTVPD